MKYSEAIAEILLSNGEEYEQARKVIAGNLDNLAEVFGPRIRELSQFRTRPCNRCRQREWIRAKPSCSGQAPTWRLQICSASSETAPHGAVVGAWRLRPDDAA